MCLSNIFDDLDQYHCQILFLAKHIRMQKVRLMLLDQDPWSSKRAINLSVVSTSEIKLPSIPIEKVQSVNLLAQRDEVEHLELALLF